MVLLFGTFSTVTAEAPTYKYDTVSVDTTSDDLVLTPVSPHVTNDVQSVDYVTQAILNMFPDAPIMVTVAKCESGLDPLADRINYDGRTGIDVGLFQINQVHLPRLRQLGFDRKNLHDNLAYTRMLYDEQGLGPWYMSKHCWSKYA